MARPTIQTAAALLAGLLVVLAGCASGTGAARSNQSQSQPAPVSSPELRRYSDRYEMIRDELEELGAPAPRWAGHYNHAELGWGFGVSIAPLSGAAYSRSGCLGTWETKLGRLIESDDDSVTVRWSGRVDPRTTTFLSVRWGDRWYLVPREQVPAFCEALNRRALDSGYPPQAYENGSFFWLNREDRGKQGFGLPTLPVEFLGLIDAP